MRIMDHELTPADARVLVVGTGRMELASTRQQPAAGADDALSRHFPHRLVVAPPGTPVAVAGDVFARLRLGHHLPRAAAVGPVRDGGPAAPPSGSGSGIRIHPGNRQPVGGKSLGGPA